MRALSFQNCLKVILFGSALTPGVLQARPFIAPHIQVEFISETAVPKTGQDFWVGIHFQLEKDWHIYWNNPGDSGTAPSIKWTLPPGMSVGEIRWPYPKRIEVQPLVNYGYENDVLLMVPLTVSSEAILPAVIKAKVSWLVCREICIPGQAEFEIKIPSIESNPDPFKKTRELLPNASLPSGVGALVHETDAYLELKLRGFVGKNPLFFPGHRNEIEDAFPQKVNSQGNQVTISLKKSDQLLQPVKLLQGVLVWEGPNGRESAQIDAPVAQRAGMSQMFVFAFIGGILLNLMPCVFPVLSIKALGLMQNQSEEKQKARLQAWVYAGGVLVSFWFLTALLVLLRKAGQQIGWGFQLQSPGFIAFLVYLLFFFALNLLDVFEVGAEFMGVGQKLTFGQGYKSSFFTGVLAAVVSTPCSAPFMGTAVGFALSQPTPSTFLIFTSLGAGLAVPYVVLAYVPIFVNFLPRPGQWMVTFRQLMAFPILGTVVWFIWVYGLQTDVNAVAKLLSGVVGIGLAGWILGRFEGSGFRWAAFLLILMVLGFTFFHKKDVGWEKYSPNKITEFRSQGRPVFLDFTAAWCISCQVNELVVFGSPQVRQKFRELNVIPMKADWTNRDDQITQALSQFGRSGVPFYVLYSGKPDEPGTPLPEILTPQIVLDALEKIKK